MTYDEAYQAACKRAVELGTDQGIEKNQYTTGGFRVFMLPRPENRCGHELRCEVVTPALAKAVRCADGTFSGGGK